jgi:quercetin 2,3-dioxygenase
LYVFVLEGQVDVGGVELMSRDAMALTKINEIELSAASDSSILIIDVPMK